MVRKNVKSVIQDEVRQVTKDYLWSIIKFSLVLLLLFYLSLAIYSSQAVPPLYFHFITESKQSAVEMLKSIRVLPQFDQILQMQHNIYGQSVDLAVFGEENQRSSAIERLQALLPKNPNSRDVLYGLYLLYKEKGDQNSANMYLEKAQSIDPRIK